MPTPSELFTTYNPYPGIGTQYSAGLDYIIANITTGDVDDLVTQVTNYVSSLGLLPNTAPVQMEISSVAYNAINSYINGQKGNYSGGQLSFVNRMTGPSFTSGYTTDSLPTRIFDVQQNIPQAGLSPEQQQPLYIATMIGQTAYTYWLYQINNASTSPWTTYLSPALTSATANLSFYSAAAMHGSLFGARSTFKGMIEETTQIVTVNIVSALTAALTVGAGKVMFGWIQRIPTPRMQIGGKVPYNIGSSNIRVQKGGIGRGPGSGPFLLENCTDDPRGSGRFMCCDSDSGQCLICTASDLGGGHIGMACNSYDCGCDLANEPHLLNT